MRAAKKIVFTACHSGKLKLAFTSPDIISTSPKNFLTSRIDFTVLLFIEFLKHITCLSGKLKTEFTSPIAKSTNPGLSDTAFFACCTKKHLNMILCTQIEDVFLKENSGTVKHPTLPITPLPPQN